MITEQLLAYPSYRKITENIRGKKNTAVFGVCQNQRPYVARLCDGFVLYVAADFVRAKEVLRQLNAIGGGFVYLPPRDEVLLAGKGSSAASRAARNSALFAMTSGVKGAVTTVEGLCQIYPRADSFLKNVITLKKGGSADIFEVCARLVAAGYKNAEQITAVGEFTRKGDILDVFCPGSDNPYRIEFFGDDIEDIRVFDKVSRKSLYKTEKAVMVPLNQFFAGDFDADVLKETVMKSARGQKLSPDDRVRLDSVTEDVFTALDNGDFSGGWLMPFVRHSLLADYMPPNSVVVWEEPKQLVDKISGVYEEHYRRLAYLMSKGEVLPQGGGQLVDKTALFGVYDKFTQMSFQGVTAANGVFYAVEAVNLKSGPVVNYHNKIDMLADDVRNWNVTGYRVMICGGDTAEALRDELSAMGVLVGIGEDGAIPREGAVITHDDTPKGFIDHDNKIAVIGHEDVFPKSAKKQKVRKSGDKVFTTPEVGDYVVHEVHGIGRCEGIVSMSGSFGTKDFIEVKYRDGDTLYVPVDSSNLLTKYSGSEKAPKLSKLGGNDFEKIKAKVKANIKEMAFDLIKLYAAREHSRGFRYPKDGYLEQKFAEAFPYAETADQLKCIADVDKDLESDKIMDRLICGDVGYGKTEVALRAAFKVMAAGKQVAFLSPTTILAEQHFKTACARMEEFGFNVKCLNRFRAAKEQKEIVGGLADGSVEMVCGTHRLLGKDVVFKDLGLLILDEEQRFGVEAKESIKNIKNNVDVLTLSATPIPRTLHMALTGMRDISVIQSPPKDRMPVETYVLESTDALMTDVITREVGRGGQVFFIYNRVETIERFAFHLKELMPDVRFVVAHGQMREADLEKNIYDFVGGGYDVLVSSTIIENGIDIPNANTLIVYDADNFGLSQLYQLRGRVGRSNRRAFAYFMYRENKVLTDVAYKRLGSILEYTELGSGFKIAMRDLEIRGAGNVLGREQHGHMEKVGYDMYCKLLAESVDELRGVRTKNKIETAMDIAVGATAGGYIDDSESRMALYQRLASIGSESDAAELLEEITDIYGAPPKEVRSLIDISLLKQKASALGISEITVRNGSARLSFAGKDYLQTPGVFAALEKFKNTVRLDVTHKIEAVFDCGNESAEKAFDKVFEFVRTAEQGGK